MRTRSVWNLHTSLSAAVLAVASLSTASYAQAQTMKAQVTVPFAFEYGSRHHAAGVYSIDKESGPAMLVRNGSDAGFALTLPDIDAHPAKTSKVVFRRYGDRYFLQEIWTAGSLTHLHCVQSSAEKQAESLELASKRTAPKGLELALAGAPR